MNITWAGSGRPIMAYQCFPHDPKMVRKPDVSFIRAGRLPGDVLPSGFVRIAPDLAVEVVSPNDLAPELDEKLEDYQKAGVRLVWVIYPESRTVSVYRGDGSASRLHQDDVLSGEDVIPGFRCEVGSLFPPIARPRADESVTQAAEAERETETQG